jgi:hypothetical protein
MPSAPSPPSPAPGPPSPSRGPVVVSLAVVGALVLAYALVRVARDDRPASDPAGAPSSAPSTSAASDEAPAASAGSPLAVDASRAAAASPALATFTWGSGRGRIGRPDDGEEAHGETPLRLAVDAHGTAHLLDGENGRLLRVLPDGGLGDDVKLPVKDPVDVAVAKDGSLVLLARQGEEGAKVTLAGPDGRARGTLVLPEDVAKDARSVVVSGKDVYVESHRGELTRVGDTSGAVDPSPALAPGHPTRDGKAFVSAILPSPDAHEVHVFVTDGASQRQRWSRLVRPTLAVEGISLADTDQAGVVYLVVTGAPPGGGDDRMAQLLCLEPTRGDLLGSVDLSLDVGPEAIEDAKALDAGGVVLTVSSRAGLRVERHDCR